MRYRGPPTTLRDIRKHGVRRLLIYCTTGHCHHSAVIDADRWPDDTVFLDLGRKLVFTKCGIIGAQARSNWTERTQSASFDIGQSRPPTA